MYITFYIHNGIDIISGNGIDYESGPYIAKVPNEADSAEFIIPITNDVESEETESFTISIDKSSLPNNVFVGNPGTVTVTIVDDDDGR